MTNNDPGPGSARPAVASLSTVGLTIWSRRHPRHPGPPWPVRPTGVGSVYEVLNNTGYLAEDVTLDVPGATLVHAGPHERVEPGTPVYPVIGFSPKAFPVIEITWRSRGKIRTFRTELAPIPHLSPR